MPYAYYFVVQEMPTDPASATKLSLGMSNKYGIDGCELISVTAIPNSDPPELLLAFQQEV